MSGEPSTERKASDGRAPAKFTLRALLVYITTVAILMGVSRQGALLSPLALAGGITIVLVGALTSAWVFDANTGVGTARTALGCVGLLLLGFGTYACVIAMILAAIEFVHFSVLK